MKDAGLTSLVRQPVGLDGIHQLRPLLLHGSLFSPYRWSPHLFPQSESIFTLPLPPACPPPPFLSCPPCLPSCRLECGKVMDRRAAAQRGTYLDWCVSLSLSNVAEVYSLAMLHYSRMAGPEMFDCTVPPPHNPLLPLSHSFSGSEL